MSKLTAFVLSGVVAGLCLAPAVAGDGPRSLSVSGTGVVKAVPDEADISAGVVADGPNASQALSANSRAMAAVLASLKRQGIADKAVQTTALSLAPRYQTCKGDGPCAQTIIGYEASNTIAVTVPVDKAGGVLDALVASGSNRIGGIGFAIHDPAPLLTEARAAAVKDAIAKAETYAKAAGVTLGPILSIQDGASDIPRPMFKAFAARAEMVPLAAGEESVSAGVSITWQIK